MQFAPFMIFLWRRSCNSDEKHMRRKAQGENQTSEWMKGRAARVFAAAATVFLCVFTALEFTALELEAEIPALAALTREENFWRAEMEREELALDDSAENEVILTPGQRAQIENLSEVDDGAGRPEGETLPYYIKINRKQNCITVYTLDASGEYTVPYRAMICSTGLYNATPRGVFQLSTKYRWRELYGGVYGQYATRIHGGVLFHSVPYYRKSESSLCTDKYNKLGQQASMGCVRLTVEDAKWISENCPEGTTVEIYEDEEPGPLGKPEAQKIDADNPNRGWDPTDPSEKNPWREDNSVR